jgi:hypothetical protein
VRARSERCLRIYIRIFLSFTFAFTLLPQLLPLPPPLCPCPCPESTKSDYPTPSDCLVSCFLSVDCPSTNGNSSLIKTIARVDSIPCVSILSALGGSVVHRGRGRVVCRRFGGSRESGDVRRSPVQIVDRRSDVIDGID